MNRCASGSRNFCTTITSARSRLDGRTGTSRGGVALIGANTSTPEEIMGFGRGLILWLLGIPLPIILLLALFWHN
jgi:hypothetical protein